MTDTLLCAGCLRDDEESSADSWCTDCSELVCKPCAKVHKRFSPPHKIKPANEVSSLSSGILQVSQYCEKHTDEKIVMFCCQHDTLICPTCVAQAHQSCQPVMSIEKAAKGVRESSAMADLEKRLENIGQVTDSIIAEGQHNVNLLDERKKAIHKKKSEIRKMVEMHLDDICQKLEKDLEVQYENSVSRLKKQQSDLQNVCSYISQWKSDLKSLKSLASDVHLFQAVKILDAKSNIQESFVLNLQDTRKRIDIIFKPKESLVDIPESIKTFGRVLIKEKDVEKGPDSKQLIDQGQVFIKQSEQKLSQVNHFKLSKLGDITEGRVVSAVCFVPDNKLLVACGRLFIVCDYEGNQSRSTKLKVEPFQMILYDNTLILFTTAVGGITKLDLPSLTTVGRLDIGRHYGSICGRDKIVWVHSALDAISQIEIDGTVIRKVRLKDTPQRMRLSSTGDIYLIFSVSVSCVTPEGNDLAIYTKPDTEYLGDLVLDKKDNVYITDMNSASLNLISSKGLKEKTLLTLSGVSYLDYNFGTDEILIVNEGFRSITTYKMKI